MATGWTWAFYGPGHATTIELSNRVADVALKKAAAKRQAQANDKKWKEDEKASIKSAQGSVAARRLHRGKPLNAAHPRSRQHGRAERLPVDRAVPNCTLSSVDPSAFTTNGFDPTRIYFQAMVA